MKMDAKSERLKEIYSLEYSEVNKQVKKKKKEERRKKLTKKKKTKRKL